MKKIAMTLVLGSAMALPTMVSAQTMTPTNTQTMTPPTQTFANRGQCQSTLAQFRNELRRTAKPAVNSGTFNQTFKPLFVCDTVMMNGKTMFKIVPKTTGQ